MEATSKAVCKHFETHDKSILGRCWASPVWYDKNGSRCVEFIDCPFQGDTQRCLDYLIKNSEQGILCKYIGKITI